MGKHQPTPTTTEVVAYGSDFVLPLTNEAVAQEVEAILRRLDVRNRMHAAALAGNDSVTGSLVIREIRKDIAERLGRSKNVADRALSDCERLIADIDLDPFDPELIAAETLGEVSQTLNQHASSLVAAVAVAADAKRYWLKFRLDRNIERDALHPSPANTVMVLIASAAAEVVVGTYFYDGAADSVLSALIYAGGASAVVMAAGLASGWSLRHAVYRAHGGEPLSRLFGRIAFAAASISVVTVALTIGHYRDRLAAYAIDPAIVPKLDPSIVLRPWDWLRMDTLDGMLMAGMTFGLGVIAAIKGWRGFSDPILGYSWVDRKYRDLASDAHARQQEARSAVNEVIDHASSAVDQELARQKALCSTAESHAREGLTVTRLYATTAERLLDIGNAAVRGAQEAHQEIRPELPAYLPSSYLEAADIPTLEILPQTLQSAAAARRETYDQNRKVASGIKRTLVQARAKLSAVIENAIGSAVGLDHDESERRARWNLSGGDQ